MEQVPTEKSARLDDTIYHPLSAGEHVRLIKPATSQAESSLGWLSDPEVGQYMGADFSNISIDTETKRLQDIIDSDDEYNWMLEKDGKVIGNIAIREIYERSEQQGGKSGILVVLIGDKSYWGQGIATAAERAVLSWAFDEGGFESLLARVNPDNAASLKTLEKLKAKQVGVEPNDAGKDWLLFKFTKLSN